MQDPYAARSGESKKRASIDTDKNYKTEIQTYRDR